MAERRYHADARGHPANPADAQRNGGRAAAPQPGFFDGVREEDLQFHHLMEVFEVVARNLVLERVSLFVLLLGQIANRGANEGNLLGFFVTDRDVQWRYMEEVLDRFLWNVTLGLQMMGVLGHGELFDPYAINAVPPINNEAGQAAPMAREEDQQQGQVGEAIQNEEENIAEPRIEAVHDENIEAHHAQPQIEGEDEFIQENAEEINEDHVEAEVREVEMRDVEEEIEEDNEEVVPNGIADQEDEEVVEVVEDDAEKKDKKNARKTRMTRRRVQNEEDDEYIPSKKEKRHIKNAPSTGPSTRRTQRKVIKLDGNKSKEVRKLEDWRMN